MNNNSNISYEIETPVFPEAGEAKISVSRHYAYGEVDGPALKVHYLNGNIITHATDVLVATGEEIRFSAERGYHKTGKQIAKPETLAKIFEAAPQGNAWLNL
jgi:hypothetical protein